MAEVKSESLPFPAGALHTNPMTASEEAAMTEGEARYYGLQQTVLELGRQCLGPGSRVVDLNCQLDIFMPLVLEHEDLCRFVALSPDQERSWSCFDLLRTRVRLGFVDAACFDLREGFPHLSGRMILCIGAFDSLPTRRMMEVLESIRRHLDRGGVAVIGTRVADNPDCSGLEGAGTNRHRCDWSAIEWESCFKEAGFVKVSRIWDGGGRMAWSLEK